MFQTDWDAPPLPACHCGDTRYSYKVQVVDGEFENRLFFCVGCGYRFHQRWVKVCPSSLSGNMIKKILVSEREKLQYLQKTVRKNMKAKVIIRESAEVDLNYYEAQLHVLATVLMTIRNLEEAEMWKPAPGFVDPKELQEKGELPNEK